MYPKVKVKVRREEEDADQYALELTSLQSLKGFENLSSYDSSPDESPTSIVRIPSSLLVSSATPEAAVSKGATIHEKQIGYEETKNIRTNLVFRPRAVLSSPDNDEMIGSNNKTKEELVSRLKNQNLCQNRHTKCKITARPEVAADPSNTRKESKGADDSKKNPRTKGRSMVDDPTKIASHRKGKPESVRSKASTALTTHK